MLAVKSIIIFAYLAAAALRFAEMPRATIPVSTQTTARTRLLDMKLLQVSRMVESAALATAIAVLRLIRRMKAVISLTDINTGTGFFPAVGADITANLITIHHVGACSPLLMESATLAHAMLHTVAISLRAPFVHALFRACFTVRAVFAASATTGISIRHMEIDIFITWSITALCNGIAFLRSTNLTNRYVGDGSGQTSRLHPRPPLMLARLRGASALTATGARTHVMYQANRHRFPNPRLRFDIVRSRILTTKATMHITDILMPFVELNNALLGRFTVLAFIVAARVSLPFVREYVTATVLALATVGGVSFVTITVIGNPAFAIVALGFLSTD